MAVQRMNGAGMGDGQVLWRRIRGRGISRLIGPPKSLLRLVLTGFVVVAAPLVLALAIAAWSVNRLASESEVTVYEAVGVTENSARMARIAMELERAARGYLTHHDPAALQAYRHQRPELLDAEAPPERQGPEVVTALHQGMRVVESTLFTTLLLLGDRPTEAANWIPELSLALHRSVAAISAAGYQRIDEEVAGVHRLSERAREIVVGHLAAAVPIALAFMAFFARRIHRPFRRLSDSIRQLERPELEAPIYIGGPHDLKALGDELEQLRLQLMALRNQRQRFLRHLSHELKTPLSAVLEGAELLRDREIAADARRREEIADIIRENGHELRRQLENLLLFARHGEAAVGAVEATPVDLATVIREVVERHRLAADRRRITIRLALEVVAVLGDRGQLSTVVDNLLANALRFSPAGCEVTLRLHRQGEQAELLVLDRGEGIPASERTVVFEPFQQGGAVGHSAIKGSGLGLSLVRDCVVAHGGTVSAEPHPELEAGGTCMRVRLPAALEEGGGR